MNSQTYLPPIAEVQKLPGLFRLIEQGEIRVPEFQRGFVWGSKQILELLESLYRGIPIGTLLLWEVDQQSVDIELIATSPFPNVPLKRPFRLILDGLQRLYTLYGVFHWPDPNSPNRYNVIFDLESEKFIHYQNGMPLEKRIYLTSLFSPSDFLSAQRNLNLKQHHSEILIERMLGLHSIFQDSPIPTITIVGRGLPEAQAIFERINTVGIQLTSEEVERARKVPPKSRNRLPDR